ncbi:MAG TPA: shikimate dehydrogenase [Candidatus Dormibacteraeota bacterium]|nr:shikimate dehydrogenase [Candidatus Dormibacteraeota bacterium]
MYYSALIGQPTEHSVSHILYEELIKEAKIEVVYKHLKINIEVTKLEESLRAFETLQFSGLSVTLPHKLAIMQHLDEIDPVARALGAVNVVQLGQKRTGYNTDWIGIVESVRSHSKQQLNQAIIFGSGGAARAAIYAVKQLGCTEIYIFFRAHVVDPKTTDLMERQKDLGITMLPYENVATRLDNADIIINASSAGMLGNDLTPLPLTSFDGINVQSKIFLDAVFNPLETELISYFKKQGALTIDGLWMMIYQGIAALSIWLNKQIEIDHNRLCNVHGSLKKELLHV